MKWLKSFTRCFLGEVVMVGAVWEGARGVVGKVDVCSKSEVRVQGWSCDAPRGRRELLGRLISPLGWPPTPGQVNCIVGHLSGAVGGERCKYPETGGLALCITKQSDIYLIFSWVVITLYSTEWKQKCYWKYTSKPLHDLTIIWQHFADHSVFQDVSWSIEDHIFK